MFGRMFQPKGLPSSYRRVAWLQSDGAAYINLDHSPDMTHASSEGIGTQIVLVAKHPSTSPTNAPGCIIGSIGESQFSAFILDATYEARKIADGGTAKWDVEGEDQLGWWAGTYNATWARTDWGEYSGTFSYSGEAGEGTEYYPVSFSGTIRADGQLMKGGSSSTVENVSEHCPTQETYSPPTYGHFAIRMRTGDQTATDTYGQGASAQFFCDDFVTTTYRGLAHSDGESRKNRFDIETNTYYISPGSAPVDPPTIYLFANNNNGNASSINRLIQVNAIRINEREVDEYGVETRRTIRNLVACVRKRDEKPGFYDLKNHRFFTNAADSGEFLFAELTD